MIRNRFLLPFAFRKRVLLAASLFFILFSTPSYGAEEENFIQITGAVWEENGSKQPESDQGLPGLIVRDKSGEEVQGVIIGAKLLSGFRVILPENLSLTFRTYSGNRVEARHETDFLVSNLSEQGDSFILRSGNIRYSSGSHSMPVLVSNEHFFAFGVAKRFEFSVENENNRSLITCADGTTTVNEDLKIVSANQEITGVHLLTHIDCQDLDTPALFPFPATQEKKFATHKELLDFLQQSLEEAEAAEDRYRVVAAKNNLGITTIKTGQPTQGIPILKEAYKEAIALKSHILLSMTHNNLGQAWHINREFDKAINYFNNALNSDIKITGKRHPRLAEYLKNLGVSFQAKQRFAKATEYILKAIAMFSGGYGDKSEQLAGYYTSLGKAYFGNRNFDKAVTYYTRALEAQRDKGINTASVAASYNLIGLALKAKKEYASALEYYNQGLTIALKLFGKKHPQIALYYNNIGLIWLAQEKYEKALHFLKRGLNIDREHYGNEHITVGIDYNDYASALYENESFEKALQTYQKALTIFQNILGDHHRYVKGLKKRIEEVEEDLENSR